jgi:Na+/proline symporter
LQNDSIFPQFISSQLPVGTAGIFIAGVFAAAQSTISTMMNSISSAVTTDVARRFDLLKSEKSYLRMARILTILSGSIGTVVALSFAASQSTSMWDTFMRVIGLFGGPTGGLFLLGIFTRRAHGTGAVPGALAGVVMVMLVQHYTRTSFVLYTAIGVAGCFLMGYFFSLILPDPKKPIDDLTVYADK